MAGMRKSGDAVEIRTLQPDESDLLDQVIDLGDRNKKTLGFTTRVTFSEYAGRGRIFVAVRGCELLGYVLFDLPGHRVRLGHLCVAESSRDLGIARRLVDHLSEQYRDRLGISLRCRRDWDAARLWPKLGFEAQSNAPGRSMAGHLLTAWWRDHGHPDLFTAAAAERPRTLVAMDSNVFRDLHEPGRGAQAAESKALLADWLSDEIELVVTPTLRTELNTHTDAGKREALMNAVTRYRTVRGDLTIVDELEDALLGKLPQEDLTRDPSLRIDARLIAEAYAGGAIAFVSRDQSAVEKLGAVVEQRAELWVSTPTDLIVHLDEMQEAANYSPSKLLDTGYTTAAAGSTSEAELHRLINHGAGETAVEFRALVRRAASEVGHAGSRQIVRDPDGEICAGMFQRWTSDGLEVSLLRVAHPVLQRTMAVQLAYLIRQAARTRRLREVLVTDPYPSDVVAAVLEESGFTRNAEGGFAATVIEGCLPWTDVIDVVAPETAEANRAVRNEPPAGAIAAEMERVYWPLKIRDAALPCFLVPVRPEPAAMLFGTEESLFGRNPDLGLSRQHVYYRSPKSAGLVAPARILWYVSGYEKRVIAASRLEQLHLGHPKTLYRKFRRLGVLELHVVEKTARNGRASAIVFADTEFFSSPVPLARLRKMDPTGGLEPIPSPRRINAAQFFAVYEEGRPR
jgi:ribosomal protein S18 acetylase RimI-like enzyme